MKTAEEWVKDSEGRWDVEYVRAIQADALRHASVYIYKKIGESGVEKTEMPTRISIANDLEIIADKMCPSIK